MTGDVRITIPLDAAGRPDLQALIERAGRRHAESIGEKYDENPFTRPAHQGGYQHIAAEEWVEYDRALAEWQERRRQRLEGGLSGETPQSDRSDPEALCLCGLPGVYWRPRKVGGRPIWRCEEHRNLWPDYAIEAPDDTGAAHG